MPWDDRCRDCRRGGVCHEQGPECWGEREEARLSKEWADKQVERWAPKLTEAIKGLARKSVYGKGQVGRGFAEFLALELVKMGWHK